MNPMTNMKNVTKLSEQELQRNFKTSWHDQYKDSAWIFVGGLPYDLTEGDLICVFSQYGEIVNLNLVRDKDTGKQKGFCFICYEDQRSTVLAVDNLNGIKILGRTIRVDHVSDYKVPKDSKKIDSETRKLYDEGCAPGANVEKKPEMPIPSTELPAFAREEEAPPDGFRLPPRLPIGPIKQEERSPKKVKAKKDKKHKKEKKSKKKKTKKHKRKHSSDESSSESGSESESSTSSEEEEKEAKMKSKNIAKRHEANANATESKRQKISAEIELNCKVPLEEEKSREPKKPPYDKNKDFRKYDRYDYGKYNYDRRDKRKYEAKHEKDYRRYDDDSRYKKYANDRNDDKKRSDDRKERDRHRK